MNITNFLNRLSSADRGKIVLVTGGAGFIGSHVAELLVQNGLSVTVLDDLSSGYEDNIPSGVKFIRGDVGDAEIVEHAMKGCGVIIHLAASVGNKRSIDNPRLDSTINVLGMINTLESARKFGIGRVVFSSSAGIFGELKTLPIAENHPQEPDSPYGVSKLAAEKMCLVYNKLYGMKNVCLRYFNVYGVRQRYDSYGNVIPIFANRILKWDPITIFGDGEQTRDFVNVSDVATANILAAFSLEAQGVFNIGSGTRITINKLAQMMLKVVVGQGDIQYTTPRPGDVRDSLADITAANRAFGFAPATDLAEGLVAYLDWLKTDPISLKQMGEEK